MGTVFMQILWSTHLILQQILKIGQNENTRVKLLSCYLSICLIYLFTQYIPQIG